MSAFCAAQCWRGKVAEQGSAWSASIYILGCFPIFGGSSSLNGLFIIIIIMVKRYLASRSGCFLFQLFDD